ncbi:MAG: hypothetical protein ACLRP0_17770 [Blautia wexlerae]
MDCGYLNSAEYFHGPFEVTDEDHLYILMMSRGRNRMMDERVLTFLEKYGKKYEVIDADNLGMEAIDDGCVEYFTPMLFYTMTTVYRTALQDKRRHPLDMRRYMGVVGILNQQDFYNNTERGKRMSKYSTKLLGFGDNVVDIYDHQKTMYPGGNCVNVSVYGKWPDVKNSIHGIFRDDEEAELVIDALKKNGVETVKCRQLHGENGYSRITLKDGDREFLDFNEGGIRERHRMSLDRFDLEYMKGFDVVHSGNYSFTEEELHKMKEAGIQISFDFSDDSTEEYYRKTAPDVTDMLSVPLMERIRRQRNI